MGSTTLQLLAVLVVALASTAVAAREAFVPALGASGVLPMTQQRQGQHASSSSRSGRQRSAALGMKYVPDGLSPEQWKKMQKEEQEKKKKMGNLGQVCITCGGVRSCVISC